MNLLSWMIYFGDVSGSFDALFFLVAILLFFISIPLFIAGCVYKFDEDDSETANWLWRKLYWTLPLILVFGIFCAIIPNKTTFYLIAASEITDRTVLQDPEMQEIISLSKKRVLDYLRETEKNESERKTTEEHNG